MQQLLRIIHHRFEQKFKDYRQAFRSFDINYDGMLEFQEFVQGLQFCGIAMSYKDFRSVFNTLNYDSSGYIDFRKFCLINIDKSNDIDRLIRMTKRNKEQLGQLEAEKDNEQYYNNRMFSSKFPRKKRAGSLDLTEQQKR